MTFDGKVAAPNRARFIAATPDAEELILYIARVSSNQENKSTGLINYLIRNGHWSPFEMAHMVVEIVTSRAIAQQVLRHRSFSFQEFSQRYAVASSVVMHVGRKQAEKNRQSSTNDLSEDAQREWIELQQHALFDSVEAYKRALDIGVAKEQARFLLPMATETKIYMNGTLRSWIHYLDPNNPGARTNDHTQQEHKEIALSIKDIFCEHFPIISNALGWLHADSEDGVIPEQVV